MVLDVLRHPTDSLLLLLCLMIQYYRDIDVDGYYLQSYAFAAEAKRPKSIVCCCLEKRRRQWTNVRQLVTLFAEGRWRIAGWKGLATRARTFVPT